MNKKQIEDWKWKFLLFMSTTIESNEYIVDKIELVRNSVLYNDICKLLDDKYSEGDD